jgi:serine/threonine-protein kinase
MLREGDQLGPYTLVSKVGSGAFGTVWLADRVTPIATTRVALKVPSRDDVDLEAIKHEATTWVQASGHPNVVPIIEANVYDGQIVIASEYIAEGSLEGWLNDNGGKAPTVEAAAEMTLGILAGLGHLHSRQIIHRDLKPANLLIQGQTPRLADFGISRVLKTTSRTALAAGTPSYMAPEAFDGKRTEQTDLWSVGVMLYQMLAGRLPFPQQEMTSLIGAICSRNPEPLPISVPNSLQAFIAKSLAKDAVHRHRSAGEMRAALREAMEAARRGGVQPLQPGPTQPAVRRETAQPPFPQATGPAQPAPTMPPRPQPTVPPVQQFYPQQQQQYYPQPHQSYASYPPQVPMKKGTSPVVYVLIAAIAVLVIGGGIFAFIKLRENPSAPVATTNSTSNVVKTEPEKTNGNISLPSYPTPGNDKQQLPITPLRPENLGNNLYVIKGAGLQFQAPPGWRVQEGKDQILLFAPDSSVSMIFQAVEMENLKAIASAMDSYIASLMTNVTTDGPVETMQLNGMTLYSQSGKGVLQGQNVEWSSEVIMAGKPVIVVSFAAIGLYEKHQQDIYNFIQSIKRSS